MCWMDELEVESGVWFEVTVYNEDGLRPYAEIGSSQRQRMVLGARGTAGDDKENPTLPS